MFILHLSKNDKMDGFVVQFSVRYAKWTSGLLCEVIASAGKIKN